MTLPSVYCVKCKTKTDSTNGQIVTNKRGGKMLQCTCSSCGCKKCMMVSKEQKGGAWYDPTTW